MEKITILWADDEIESLRAQLVFLQSKGYEVITVSNGHDALDEIKTNKTIDMVFLDESMPGIGGLETLSRIKEFAPNLPVVMITKNEEDHVMEEAIGAQIADYLLKPVNPVQVLSAVRKIVDKERLVRDRTATDYQQDFRKIFTAINSGMDYNEWVETYRKIIYWELQLDRTNTEEMSEILANQKVEANAEFSKFVAGEYVDWFKKPASAPVFSHQLLQKKVFPQMSTDSPTFFVLLDNLRFDQWKAIEPIVSECFRVEEEDFFFSILPTATQYSRNAIFAGMTPAEIEKRFPDKWLNDNEEGGKNLHEAAFLTDQIKRLVKRPLKHDYVKVVNAAQGRQLEDNVLNYLNNDFTAIVYNFIDMLSHARTEMEVLKELAGDEKAYRDLTRTWFLNSPLWTALKKAAERDIQLFIATDHGTIRVNTPSRVVGDRETTTNLRYKMGRNLQYEKRDVLEIKNPKDVGLPSPNVSSTYIFAKEDHFFLYPNNYTHYNNFYRNTFQHGGISLEEMIVPIIRLRSK
jgi:CheY-like chemotaxis protein